MPQAHTWRQYLGKLLETPAERRRLAQALGVGERTLKRWAAGVSNPRSLAPLQQLLDALPNHRNSLLELLGQEFPLEGEHAAQQEEFFLDEVIKQIPAPFYTRILETSATSVEPMRSWSLKHLILQQISKHLDSEHVGVAVLLVACLPPQRGQMVRSLVVQLRWGTAPTHTLPGSPLWYCGAESLAGMAVATGLPVVVADQGSLPPLLSAELAEGIHSAAASPIQRAGQIAGCVLVLGRDRLFFSPTRLRLLTHYSCLLALAFGDHELYSQQEIALWNLPDHAVQQSLLGTFADRVNQELFHAEQRREELSRPAAEQMVAQHLETALLHQREQGKEDEGTALLPRRS